MSEGEVVRAGIIARVSSLLQVQPGAAGSLNWQLDACREYCGRRAGWVIVEEYLIPGESAYKWRLTERPQFAQAIDAARTGAFDVLVVYDLSRFGRNQTVFHEVRRLLKEAGCALWVVSGDFDAIEDSLRAGIEMAIAERASQDTSRRTRAGKASMHYREGLPAGGAIPFGYRFDKPNRRLIVVVAEAEVVRRLFVERGTGVPVADQVDWLNTAGWRIPSPKKSTLDPGRWISATLFNLYRHRIYLGEVRYEGHVIPNAHEAIVTEEEWEAAQTAAIRRGPRSASPLLLTGFAICDLCEQPIWADSRRAVPSASRGLRGAYRDGAKATRANAARECATAGQTWRQEPVEGAIRAAIVAMASDPDWLAQAARLASRASLGLEADGGSVADEAALEGERRRLGEVYAAGAMDRGTWQERTRAINARLASLRAPTRLRSTVPVVDAMQRLGQLWDGAEVQWRRDALRALCPTVRLSMQERRVLLVPGNEQVAAVLQHRVGWCASATRRQPEQRYTTFDVRHLAAA